MRFNVKRYLTFFIGLPIILCVLIFEALHGVFIGMVLVTTVIAGFEVKSFFTRNTTVKFIKSVELVVLSSCFPVLATLNIFIDFQQHTYLLILTGMFMYLCVRSILNFRDSPSTTTLYSLASRLLVLIYPGLFSYFLIALTTIPNAGAQLTVFVLAVYGGDGLAYLIGKLSKRYTKNTAPFISVSPRKTIAGFIAAIVGGMIVYSIAPLIVPNQLSFSSLSGLLIGAIIGFGGIIGDLTESYLKRIAKKKNSGDLIPGRGGMLDSYDSVSFAAPIAYFIFTIL